jgi:hypothetical protein
VAARFDPEALARQVLELEREAVEGFVSKIWALGDMLGQGLRVSGMGVTHYTEVMAAALGRSGSFVDKYLRFSRVSPSERSKAQGLGTFNALWRLFFPGRQAPQLEPAQRHSDTPASEPGPESELDPAPPSGPAPDSPAQDNDKGDPEPEPSDGEHKGGGASENAIADVLSALEAADVSGALARIAVLRQREQAALAEAERLRKEVEQLKRDRKTLLDAGHTVALLRELGVRSVKQALGAVRELKNHAAE